MNVAEQMLISEMLETPPGINSCFTCMPMALGPEWIRDYEKTKGAAYEELFETHEEYLESNTYMVFALYELVKFKQVPVSHWTYNHN